MKLDLPVLLLLLSLAACLEEFLPGLPLPAPWLAGVSIYYSLRRTFPMSGVVAVVAGVLHDSLGGVPLPATSLSLLALAVSASGLRTVLARDSVRLAAIAGAGSGLLLPLVQRLFLGATMVSPRGFAWLAAALSGSAASGAIAAALFFLLGRRLDTLAGNIQPRKEIDGREWPQSSG
ncbi:MAG: hypothetical protein ACOX5G_13875 [Kiritimatiellia bacterium]|jgi:hypothetical protein